MNKSHPSVKEVRLAARAMKAKQVAALYPHDSGPDNFEAGQCEECRYEYSRCRECPMHGYGEMALFEG